MKTALVLLSVLALQAAEVDRTKPPQTPPIAGYKLPPVYRTQLANGMQVMLVEDRRFPLVTVRLGFPAGGKYDPASMPGLAETAASLLTEGTKTRKSRQLAEDLASIGGNIHASSGLDTFIIAADAPSDNMPSLMQLLADVARNANFAEDEIAIRKQNRKQELLAERAQSATLATERTMQNIFGAHPYSRMLPTPADIDAITQAALIQFRDTRLIPNQAVFVFLGAIPPREQAMKLIEDNFGSWEKKPAPAPLKNPPFPAGKRDIILVDRPGSVQADISVSKLGITRKSPDYIGLIVGNSILGGSFDSRMYNNIREKEGYAYDAHSEVNPFFEAGSFSAVTQVRNEVVEPALRAVLKELTLMAQEPVKPEEIDSVKNFINGIFVLRLETQDGLAEQLVRQKLEGLPEDSIETYIPRIRAATAAQVQESAKKYMAPENASIVVVGDAAQIGKALEKIGPVKVEKPKQ